MSEAQDRHDAGRSDLALWREMANEQADDWACFCYRCDACRDECPAVRHGLGFNPREIMLKVQFGLAGTLLHKHSIVWQCFACYKCRDRCSQELKPVDVMNALKEMLRDVVFPARHSRAAG